MSGDNEYFSASKLAELLHVSRPAVYKRAAREKRPEMRVPGRGERHGVKHFLVADEVLTESDLATQDKVRSKPYPVSKTAPLVTGSGQHNGLSVQSHSGTDMRVNNFMTLPKYDLQSTSRDHVIHSEQIVDHLAFKKEWLEMSLNVQ